jgi:hypothetical protein
VVTKVEKKYFSAKEMDAEFMPSEDRYHLVDWTSVDKWHQGHTQLYTSKQGYLERKNTWKIIYGMLQYAHSVPYYLTLENVRAIYGILDEARERYK